MIVLIDDDKLIRLSWTIQAKSKNLPIACFQSIKEFLLQKDSFSFDTQIYIDSDLGGEKGEVEAELIFKLGFINITLCTGFIELDISQYPWISKKISKRPPF